MMYGIFNCILGHFAPGRTLKSTGYKILTSRHAHAEYRYQPEKQPECTGLSFLKAINVYKFKEEGWFNNSLRFMNRVDVLGHILIYHTSLTVVPS